MTDKRYPDRRFKDDGPEKDEWKREGIELAQRHDATVWEIGEWGLRGRQSFGPGECRRIIEAPGWQGVKYDTVKVYMCVAKRYPKEFRYLNTSTAHYHSARVLPLEQSIPLLTQAAAENWNLNKLRIAVRRIRWFEELIGGDVIDDLNGAIQQGRKWRGILADCPWEWDSAGHPATLSHHVIEGTLRVARWQGGARRRIFVPLGAARAAQGGPCRARSVGIRVQGEPHVGQTDALRARGIWSHGP